MAASSTRCVAGKRQRTGSAPGGAPVSETSTKLTSTAGARSFSRMLRGRLSATLPKRAAKVATRASRPSRARKST